MTLLHADCIQAMSEMEPSSIDAIVTDPPYGLGFMGKEWDRKAIMEASLKTKANGPTNHHSAIGRNTAGFGQADKAGGAYDRSMAGNQAFQLWTQSWASEALRVLKPGGSLLSFGGTRTFHRLTCGLEDAGFTIKDCLMWLYGQGFPKAQDLGKMIDKRLGVEREVVGENPYNKVRGKSTGTHTIVAPQETDYLTAPATPLAHHWDGYKIGGIKPAWEPIIWAVKPPEGAWIDNVLTYGVGAVNVDECRVGVDPGYSVSAASDLCGDGGWKDVDRESNPKGRFPANLLLSHTPDCREVGTKRVKSNSPSVPERSNLKMFVQDGMGRSGDYSDGYADPDGLETISAWECVEDCPVRLLDEQTKGLTAGGSLTGNEPSRPALNCYGEYPNRTPWEAYGDIGGASRFFYTSKATDRQDYNDHPTLKPTDLIEWLIRLVTRPGQTVLDPFAGSGTTGVAAIQSGREFILIEQDEHYIDICERRTSDGAQQGMF